MKHFILCRIKFTILNKNMYHTFSGYYGVGIQDFEEARENNFKATYKKI